MPAKKKVRKVVQKYPRELKDEVEFLVRDLNWAAGINCACGYQLDLFVRNIPEEMVCSRCGRRYAVKLVGYELEKVAK